MNIGVVIERIVIRAAGSNIGHIPAPRAIVHQSVCESTRVSDSQCEEDEKCSVSEGRLMLSHDVENGLDIAWH